MITFVERRGWAQTTLFGLCLLVLACTLFWRAVLLGEVVSAADILFFEDQAFATVKPEVIGPIPRNALLSDNPLEIYPWRYLAWESLRSGELPFWNPYSFGGSPLLANGQSAVFFPVNLLTTVLPFQLGFTVLVIARLWIVGMLTWWYARAVGLGGWSSAVAGITFALSGFMITWLSHAHTNVVIFLPGLLLAIEQIARGRHPVRWAVLLAAFAALQFLGGYIQASIHIYALSAVYAVVRLGGAPIVWKQRAVRAGLVVAGLGLGVGLAAIQLLPTLELLFRSVSYSFRTAIAGGNPLFRADIRPLTTLSTILLPDIFGHPIRGAYLAPFTNYTESMFYAGSTSLGLALLAVWRARRYSLVLFWAITALVCILIAVRAPLFELAYHLPLIGTVRHSLLRSVIAFAIAVLAGFGVQWLLAREGRTRLVAVAWGAVLGAATLTLAAATAWQAFFPSQFQSTINDLAVRLGLITATPGGGWDVTGQVVVQVLRTPQTWAPLAFGFALILVWVLRDRGLLTGARLGAGLTALVTVTMVTFAYGFQSVIPPAWVYPEPPLVSALREQAADDRVVVLGRALSPNTATMWGIHDFRGSDPLVPAAISDRIHRSPATAVAFPQYVTFRGIDDQLFDLAGIGLIARIDENRRPVLERRPAPSRLLVVTQPGTKAAQAGTVTSQRRTPQSETIEVEAASDGFLLRRDNWDPGWQATVNGASVTVQPANDGFWQAIPIPAGASTVQTWYEPPWWRLALVISGLSVLATAGLGAWGWRR